MTNFTKATIRKTDKLRLEALKRQMTIIAHGQAVSEADVLKWLISLGEQELTGEDRRKREEG